MALLPMSSTTNVLAANYNPGRPLTGAEISARQKAGGLPMSSQTNMQAANYSPASSHPAANQGYSTSSGGGGGGAPAPVDRSAPQQGWGQTFANSDEYDKYAAMFDNTFNQTISDLNKYSGDIETGYNTDVANLGTRVDSEKQAAAAEQKQLLGQEQIQEDTNANTIQSAIGQATRAYNALAQQARARFGFGGSAGGALGELAQQEYFRQQGQIGTKQADLAKQYTLIRDNIGQFVSKKITDLDNYKNDALSELTKNFRGQLAGIQQQKNATEQAKAQAKLSLIQQAQAQATQIYQADQAFRQNLAVAAIGQIQQVSGRQMSVPEIKTTLSEFGINIDAPQTLAYANVQNPLQPNRKPGSQDEFSSSGLVAPSFNMA